jgi:hypothetical protein
VSNYLYITGSNFVLEFLESDINALAEAVKTAMNSPGVVTVFVDGDVRVLVDFSTAGPYFITSEPPRPDALLVRTYTESIQHAYGAGDRLPPGQGED